MSVLIRAGILALGAVLLIPSGSARGEAAPQETLLLVVEAPSAKETITVLRDGDAQEEDFETYLTQVVLSEMPADFAIMFFARTMPWRSSLLPQTISGLSFSSGCRKISTEA